MLSSYIVQAACLCFLLGVTHLFDNISLEYYGPVWVDNGDQFELIMVTLDSTACVDSVLLLIKKFLSSIQNTKLYIR